MGQPANRLPGRPGGREPGGWKADPTGRFDERLFVGGRWTQRIRFRGAEAIDPVDVESADPLGNDWKGSEEVRSGDCGWRRDPTGRFEQRWFDGARFTRKVRAGGAIATDVRGSSETRGRMRSKKDRDAPEPGWYDDPDGRGQRYWDGFQWTAKQRDGPSRSPEHSMRGWWSQTVLMAAGVVLVVLVIVGLIVGLILAL